ncbi:MAG: hypothetical protein R3335_10550 [Anaerolineales bacterium]|nr:hypothetical protein [Anaerolineales bacterium]
MPDSSSDPQSPQIGTLAERSLHAAIKEWYAQPGDRFEVPIDGYVADLVRDDLLIEIQTGNFSKIRTKLSRLLDDHPVRVLHPIASNRWIVYQRKNGQQLRRRKSPKHGRVLDLFHELVYIPGLLAHPNLSIEAVLIHEEEVREESDRWSWRRKGWKTCDRRLLEVREQASFRSLEDFLRVIPETLPEPFTNRELATALNCNYNLAQKITYTLREAQALEVGGKRGNTLLYQKQ